MEAKQTHLIELLERIPQDAMLVVEHDQFSSSSYPVGRLCHKASTALRAALAEPEPKPIALPSEDKACQAFWDCYPDSGNADMSDVWMTCYRWCRAIVAAPQQQAEPEPEPITDYWYEHYIVNGLCGLCGNRGVIDTRGTTTPAGVAAGGLFFCICPNGQVMRKYKVEPAEPEQEPVAVAVADPFADIRGKRMSELNDEQADRARERWLRDQIGPQESYWYPHFQALFRIIDRLRAVPAEPEPVAPPTRRPLTLEEIMDAVRDADLDWHTGWSLGDDAPNRFITLIRAAERAHAITGGNDE